MSGKDLTRGSVTAAVAGLAVPMMLGILAAMSVALVDAYFLGRLGTEELAAISFTFPVVFTITSLAIGLGAGTASVVSRAIGEGDRAAVKRVSTDALVLAVIAVAVLSALGWLTARPLFALLGAEGEVLDHIVGYMRVWYIGMPFLVVPMVSNNILRAGGDAVVPAAIMIAVSLINAALDPLLIFGLWGLPRMEVEGAAWASVIARAVTAVISVGVVVLRERLIEWSVPAWSVLWASWRRVMAIGVPAAVGNAISPLAITVVTAIVAGFGAGTVAAFGVATRIEAFAAIPMLAMSAAIGPVAGQNWGAGECGRVVEALRRCYLACLIWGLLSAVVFWLAGPAIVGVFAPEPEVAREAARYLRVVPVTLAGYGVVVIAAGAYNALGRPLTGLAYYLVRSAALYVPLSWAAASMAGSQGIYLGIACANALGGAVVAVHSLRWLSRAEQDDCSPAARPAAAAG